jgi:uncharacterized protein (TIGR02145 family)
MDNGQMTNRGSGHIKRYVMIKKVFTGLYALALVCAVCSCSRDDEGTPASREWPVRFSSDLSERTVSRAANDSWDAGDRVGVYMVPHVADASAAVDFSVYTDAVNVPYVTSGSGTSVSLSVVSGRDAIVYPRNDGYVNFVAYYPYRSDTHTVNANVYKVNVSNQSPSKAIDLLYHKGAGTAYDSNNKTVSLAFIHQLSKIKICLVPASDNVKVDLSATSLTLSGFPTTADFDLSTGVLSNRGGTIPSLTPVTGSASAGQVDFEAIVVPHGGLSARTMRFVIGGTTYTYSIPDGSEFVKGVACNYILKFTGNEVVLGLRTYFEWNGNHSIAWGNDYLLTASHAVFNLNSAGENLLTQPLQIVFFTTATTGSFTWTTSLASDVVTTNKPDWITSALTPGSLSNGWRSYALTFTAARNDSQGSVPRTGYFHARVGGLTVVVTVNQEAGNLPPPVFPTYTVDGMTNSYMVVPGKSVTFPVSRAYTFDSTNGTFDHTLRVADTVDYTGGFVAKVIWQDPGDLIASPTSTASAISGSGNTATVTVQTNNKNGNAVVGIYKPGDATPVWSYHIWVTDYDLNNGGSTYENKYTYNSNPYSLVFMNRNLGASNVGKGTDMSDTGRTHGLYYQWGRKDPFPGAGSVTTVAANSSNGAILYSIKNPDTFITVSNSPSDWHWGSRNDELWGHSGSKTIYDPCPAGWRVPKNAQLSEYTSPWYNFTKSNGVWNSGYDWSTVNYAGNTKTNALYPAAGLRQSDSGSLEYQSTYGYYWSASSHSHYAACLNFGSSSVDIDVGFPRAYGLSVRCVRE